MLRSNRARAAEVAVDSLFSPFDKLIYFADSHDGSILQHSEPSSSTSAK